MKTASHTLNNFDLIVWPSGVSLLISFILKLLLSNPEKTVHLYRVLNEN